MNHRRLHPIASFALLILAAPSLGAQRPVPVTFRGTVVDDATNKPLPDVELQIEGIARTSRTDSAGTFELTLVPSGKHVVLVRRLGYEPIRTTIDVTTRDSLAFDFSLVAMPERLNKVNVVTNKPLPAREAEFEERRKTGLGTFFTAADLEKWQIQRMSEIMRRARGVTIQYGGYSGSQGYVTSVRGGCYATVILDGLPVYSGKPGQPKFDINSLVPRGLMGVEYYSSIEAPEQFRGFNSSNCGVLVLWTK